MNPLLSIVTICYCDFEGLKRTIDGLRKQVNYNFEQLIVDGNSSDGTKAYLESLNVPWQMKFTSESDDGLYDAMNKGTKRATGHFVWYLNSGDFPASAQTTERLLNEIDRNPNADLIYGKVIFNGQYGRKIVGSAVVASDFNTGMPVSHPGILFRRELVNIHPYPTDFDIISDWIVTRTLFQEAKSAVFTNLIFTVFDVEGISSKNHWKDLLEKIRFERTLGRKTNLIIKCGFKISVLNLMKFIGLYDTYKFYQSKQSLKTFVADPTYPIF